MELMPNEIDTRTYIFDFGKYKNYSYKFVLNQDPSYIEWCVDRECFALDEDDLTDLEYALLDEKE